MKQRIKSRKLIAMLGVLLLVGLLGEMIGLGVLVADGTGPVDIVATSGSVVGGVGTTFDLEIHALSGTQPIDTAKVIMTFDPAYVTVVTITGGSWDLPMANEHDNTAGTLRFDGGQMWSPNKTGDVLVCTITFQVMQEGQTVIAFVEDYPDTYVGLVGDTTITGEITGASVSMPGPGISVLFNGVEQELDLDWQYNVGGKPGRVSASLASSGANDPVQSLTVFFDEDPYVQYGIVVMNPTMSDAEYSFIFGTPITPVGDPNQVQSSFSASWTAGGDNAATMAALAPPAGIPQDSDGETEMQVTTVSNSSQTSNIGMDLAGPLFDETGFSGVIGPFSEGFSAGPNGTSDWESLRVDLNYSLTSWDTATMNGRSEIVDAPIPPWPETATIVLMGIGLLGLGGWIWIRRRRESALNA